MRNEEKRRQFFEFIDRLNAMGFDVYSKPSLSKAHRTTYGYYTDGTRIAYFQVGEWGGIDISTVHVPNKNSGTGFRMYDGITPRDSDILSGFAHSPSWAMQRDRDSVKKFKDFEDYRTRSLFGDALTKVTPENRDSI